jgi:hypothetical protein
MLKSISFRLDYPPATVNFGIPLRGRVVGMGGAGAEGGGRGGGGGIGAEAEGHGTGKERPEERMEATKGEIDLAFGI